MSAVLRNSKEPHVAGGVEKVREVRCWRESYTVLKAIVRTLPLTQKPMGKLLQGLRQRSDLI